MSTKRKLPARRRGATFKFGVNGFEGYVTTGEFEDGNVGEIFVAIAKQGSTVAGWADAFAIAFSGALQWSTDPRATLEWLVANLCGLRFDPHGATGDPAVPEARSVIEHAMKQLELMYLAPTRCNDCGETFTDIQRHARESVTVLGTPDPGRWRHLACGTIINRTPSGGLQRLWCSKCEVYASDIEEVGDE